MREKSADPFRICVVTAARNCERWVARCLASIQRQADVQFTCAFVDDLSTDATLETARRAVTGDPRFQFYQNVTRHYPLRACGAEPGRSPTARRT